MVGKLLHNIVRVPALVRPARNTKVAFQCVFELMESISGFLWAVMKTGVFLHSSDLQKETHTAAVWQKKTEEKVFVTTDATR